MAAGGDVLGVVGQEPFAELEQRQYPLVGDEVEDGAMLTAGNPEGNPSWRPQSTLVLIGSAACSGPSFRSCCDVLNLFESVESAGRYLADRPEIHGSCVSIPVAIEAGSAIFGNLLRGD